LSFSATSGTQSANHTHGFTYNTGNVDNAGAQTRVSTIQTSGGSTGVSTSVEDSTHTHTVSGTTGNMGSGNTMPFDVNFVDLTICTRD
jgi:hypothetical protein